MRTASKATFCAKNGFLLINILIQSVTVISIFKERKQDMPQEIRSEQRKHPRLDVQLNINYQIGEQWHIVKTADLDIGGAFIDTPNPAPCESIITV